MHEVLIALWNGFKNILDILLVAYLFYRVLLLVRGTRAVQVLQGFLLLALATFLVSEVLHLTVTGWLLQKFWMAGIVILVIVFQPEIRSALAHLGSHPISRWIFPIHFDFIDEIIVALKECSEKRIGALIVLELDTGLKDYAETGIKINGEISTELILSLLHPRSPLHDGAVIISANQIAAAGCVLPLTDNPQFAKLFGTRHRAGVGLSERSDAMVLIVSEETGKISLAQNGQLEKDVDLQDLIKRLQNLLHSKTKAQNKKLPSGESDGKLD